jgi:NADP-dependent 3-hydroxy acid dehydrogenase YdfG
MTRQDVIGEGLAALVAGTSSGIGEATVRKLARRGVRVAPVARPEEELTDRAAVLVTEGHAGCLVNNAGIMLLGPFETSRTGDWQRTIDLDQRRSVAGRVARGAYSVWPPATSQPLSASSSSASKAAINEIVIRPARQAL